MNITNKYGEYFDKTILVEVTNKGIYIDKFGVPNTLAFENFISEADECEEEMYLVCLNLDLRRTNDTKGRYSGDSVMRQFCKNLQDLGAFVFHIQGEKFNLLLTKDTIDKVKELLNAENDSYQIYYAIANEAINSYNADDVISDCVNKMYEDKAKKKPRKSVGVVKKKEPKEPVLRGSNRILSRAVELKEARIESDYDKSIETFKFKPIEQFWYAIAKIQIIKPKSTTFRINIYPTEMQSELASINLIAVVDDFLDYEVHYGKMIEINSDGIPFYVSARFRKDKSIAYQILTSAKFAEDLEWKVTYEVVNDGKFVPEFWGKSLGDGREIFPIRENNRRLSDFVVLDRNNNNEVYAKRDVGSIDVDGVTYVVCMDNQGIKLAEL